MCSFDLKKARALKFRPFLLNIAAYLVKDLKQHHSMNGTVSAQINDLNVRFVGFEQIQVFVNLFLSSTCSLLCMFFSFGSNNNLLFQRISWISWNPILRFPVWEGGYQYFQSEICFVVLVGTHVCKKISETNFKRLDNNGGHLLEPIFFRVFVFRFGSFLVSRNKNLYFQNALCYSTSSFWMLWIELLNFNAFYVPLALNYWFQKL